MGFEIKESKSKYTRQAIRARTDVPLLTQKHKFESVTEELKMDYWKTLKGGVEERIQKGIQAYERNRHKAGSWAK